MNITVLGLGEAGGRYAHDLATAGHRVVGFDPGTIATPEGVTRAADLDEAVTTAELVVVLTPAALSRKLAESSLDRIGTATVWADFTSAAPSVMREIDDLLTQHRRVFADVAVLGSVPLTGARTELSASGSGAPRVAEVFGALGAQVEVLEAPGGDATARKLLRSVVMKGFATIVCEAVEAARAAGSEDWIRAQLRNQLAGGDVIVERFLNGTRQHAERRSHEMRATVEYLADLGVPREMSEASARALERIAMENHAELEQAR